MKRDFKKKYKRTVLGAVWSLLSPLMMLLVMRLVFTQFFGRHMPHYTIYLFCGNLVFAFFNESTSQGMSSLMGNASIFTKVNVPKYLFLLSKNVQCLINFALTLCIFVLFCMISPSHGAGSCSSTPSDCLSASTSAWGSSSLRCLSSSVTYSTSGASLRSS